MAGDTTASNISISSRDGFLDVARGVCMLSIVFIHTTFWSGYSYVPSYIQSISLLFDVPALFFLSGVTFSVTKRDSLISGIFRLSMTFGLLAFLYDMLTLKFESKNTILALTFNGPDLNLFSVVAGSYWFVPVYIVVSIFAVMIIKKMGKIFIPLMLVFFLYFPYCFFFDNPHKQWKMLGVDIDYIFFHLFFYLFGYFSKESIIFKKYQKQFSLILFQFAFKMTFW
jgi:fucose 4-O-acetylase-like acetyltransferase